MSSYSVTTNSTSQPLSIHPVQTLPTRREAEQMFWALGSRFWMQIIDGAYHQHGPMVFDEGLHGRGSEPGFFQSLKNGCAYASAHLTEKLTVEFYMELHKQLCSHFKGPLNNTEMTSDHTGEFKTKRSESTLHLVNFEVSLKHYFYVSMYRRSVLKNTHLTEVEKDQKYNDGKFAKLFLRNVSGGSELALKIVNEWEAEPHKRAVIEREYPHSKKWIEDWVSEWKNIIKNLNDYLDEVCRSLDIPKFIRIHLIGNHKLLFDYFCVDSHTQRSILEAFFKNYNDDIDQINQKILTAAPAEVAQLQDRKVESICFLFQMLEWLHPLQDGQGRTDLVLMTKLLCEQGESPAILMNPYVSTYASFWHWKACLIEGLNAWRREAGLTHD